jgi:hypothetical protein
MAIFRGRQSERNAVKAAIAIQKSFKHHNDQIRNEDDRILTKIGINSGGVYFWNLDGSRSNPDPQGTVVDIASRLCDLAKPEQILCTASVKTSCMNSRGINFGDEVERELKGVPGKTKICEVLWTDNKKQLRINDTGHFSRKVSKYNETMAEIKRIKNRGGDHNSAVALCNNLLALDPQDFAANVLLGRLYEKKENHADALKCFERALQSEPFSLIARDLACSSSFFVNEANLTPEKIDFLIQESESILNSAIETADEFREYIVKNSLAYYYIQKYLVTKEKQDLNKAKQHIDHVSKYFESLFSLLQASTLDTEGFIQACLGNYEEARDMLKKSINIKDNVPTTMRHLADVTERLNQM